MKLKKLEGRKAEVFVAIIEQLPGPRLGRFSNIVMFFIDLKWERESKLISLAHIFTLENSNQLNSLISTFKDSSKL